MPAGKNNNKKKSTNNTNIKKKKITKHRDSTVEKLEQPKIEKSKFKLQQTVRTLEESSIGKITKIASNATGWSYRVESMNDFGWYDEKELMVYNVDNKKR